MRATGRKNFIYPVATYSDPLREFGSYPCARLAQSLERKAEKEGEFSARPGPEMNLGWFPVDLGCCVRMTIALPTYCLNFTIQHMQPKCIRAILYYGPESIRCVRSAHAALHK